MNKSLFKKILIISSFILTISSCSKKDTTDNFDFSNFKPPNRKAEIPTDNSEVIQETKVKNKLLSLKNRDEISSSIKYGKKDPFAIKSNNIKNSLANFSLKGFVLTSNEEYALINYLGEDGTITKNSVGGVNTKFLPIGAKVKNFNFSDSEIIILLNGEEIIISTVSKIK